MMKKQLGLLLVLALLLTGCGTGAPETAARETASQESAVQTETPAEGLTPMETAAPVEGAYDLFEEDTVDDSLTFRWYWKQGEKELLRYVAEDILPQYMDTWFEDGEILDQDLRGGISDTVTGWVLIAGTPKQDMGWNSLEREGKTAYCRRIQVTHVPNSQNYHMEKTMAAPDLRYPDSLVEPDIDNFLFIDDTGLALPKILGAELYVRSLNQCFAITEPERLELLQRATTLPGELRDYTFKAGLPMDGVGNPLILDLEGQGKRVFLTDPQGGLASDLWYCHLLLMPVSVYELFGVPLEVPGCTRDKDGNTQVICTGEKPYEAANPLWQYQFTLDPQGNLTGFLDLTDYEDPFQQNRRSGLACTYDEEGRLIRKEWGSDTYTGFQTFAYNDRGLLLREETHHGEDSVEVYVYEYDDQGRMTAKLGLDEQGQEETANSYFYWYDDQGGRHGFWFRENGEAMGDPPDTPMRRPKK